MIVSYNSGSSVMRCIFIVFSLQRKRFSISACRLVNILIRLKFNPIRKQCSASQTIIFDSWSHRKSGESIQNLILPDAKKY
jgi:hypothetical protein